MNFEVLAYTNSTQRQIEVEIDGKWVDASTQNLSELANKGQLKMRAKKIERTNRLKDIFPFKNQKPWKIF